MNEIDEGNHLINEDLFEAQWQILGSSWVLRHLYEITPEEYKTKEGVFKDIYAAPVAGQIMNLRYKLSAYNTLPNIPQEMPGISDLLKKVTPWSKQDFYDKYDTEHDEQFGPKSRKMIRTVKLEK